MKNQKDSILFYGLIGAGYLLFCSVIPSVMAAVCELYTGITLNAGYAVLSFVTGILYTGFLFTATKEKMELTAGFSIKGVAEAFLTAIVLFFSINFLVSPILAMVFPASAQNYDSTVADMMSTPIATFFQVAIIAPLLEELIFRGFIMKRSLRQRSVGAAVILTAGLFGLLHMSLLQGFSAAAAGMILCLFYVRRKSVGLNILAHGIYNSMVFAMALLA